jgi:hypothetical protein
MAMAFASLDSEALLSTESTLLIPGIAKDVEVKDHIAYVSTDSGLAAVDVSNPKSPALKCFLKLPGKGNELSLTGKYAFVTDGGAKAARAIDISKPESLHVVSLMGDSCGYVWGIDSKKADDSGLAIVGIASLSGLTLFKTDSAGQSVLLSHYSPYRKIQFPTDSLTPVIGDTAYGYDVWIKTDDIVFDGVFAYVLYYEPNLGWPQELWLKKVSVADPLHPVCIDSVIIHGFGCGLEVNGGYAYVVHTSNFELKPGLDIIDIQAATMAKKSSINLPGPTEDVAIEGNRAYIACAREGIRVLNVSDPASPAMVDSFPLTLFSFPITTYGITLRDTSIYCAMGERGLWIFKKSAPSVKIRLASQKADNFRFVIFAEQSAIRIKLPHRFVSNVSVCIYTVNGKLLMQKSIGEISDDGVTITTGNGMVNSLKSGVYLLSVKNGEGASVFEKSFVIVR